MAPLCHNVTCFQSLLMSCRIIPCLLSSHVTSGHFGPAEMSCSSCHLMSLDLFLVISSLASLAVYSDVLARFAHVLTSFYLLMTSTLSFVCCKCDHVGSALLLYHHIMALVLARVMSRLLMYLYVMSSGVMSWLLIPRVMDLRLHFQGVRSSRASVCSKHPWPYVLNPGKKKSVGHAWRLRVSRGREGNSWSL